MIKLLVLSENFQIITCNVPNLKMANIFESDGIILVIISIYMDLIYVFLIIIMNCQKMNLISL